MTSCSRRIPCWWPAGGSSACGSRTSHGLPPVLREFAGAADVETRTEAEGGATATEERSRAAEGRRSAPLTAPAPNPPRRQPSRSAGREPPGLRAKAQAPAQLLLVVVGFVDVEEAFADGVDHGFHPGVQVELLEDVADVV